MKRRDFLSHTAVLAGGTAAAVLQRQATAQAQTLPKRELRLVFARGGELFASPVLDGSDARRVLTVGQNALWAVSPDGRRVVWTAQSSGSGDPAGKPGATVFLSDMLGRHQKQLLSIGYLRDRQGKSVTRAGVDAADDLALWQPVSLGWSADGRTVYVGCTHRARSGGGESRATFAADGVNGTVVVDGDGRWKLIAALSHLDAQGGLLVGIAPRTVPSASDSTESFGEIVVINLAEDGTRTPLFRPITANDAAPKDWELAQVPALSPDHRTVAYASAPRGPGLWLRDRFARPDTPSRKIADAAEDRPQWTSDGKQIFFLQDAAPAASFDLYQVDVLTATPRLVLKNVQSFALSSL